MDILVAVLLIMGFIFYTGGVVGIIRLPDFYSRLHPAGKLDSMGLLLSMGALSIYTAKDFALDNIVTALKIVFIVVFVFITSPTATHAIVDAGVRAGLTPWTRESKIGEESSDQDNKKEAR